MKKEFTYAVAIFAATSVTLSTEARTLSTKTADCSSMSPQNNLPTATVSQIGTSAINGPSNNPGATVTASDNVSTASGIIVVPTSGPAVLPGSQGSASEGSETIRTSSTTRASPSGTTIVQAPTAGSEKFNPVSWLSGILAALALIM
ncbi:hypothetical protein BDP81DRAFT_455762 [Colletotrichum phormii]|uniref:Uncharacterized protein n=1 Tax=Colletotrichum phormii TaxID=359342 RepID=A0AAI9ZCC7_9PEZI|nr:uncharacterized protein BDP81DRAFT_455762 [Colletotrichum phormii]KAK1621919.1 hypothetical protein BDP81DRAFT_455762 [Colletotrichum phormii]